ncbi:MULTISPECIES: S1C family serine protease [unclassified Thermoactinomyces]|uniref:S1C family serine protease n=1 Tax=unclassified Thermoactinomyces TaxID=2634588 RepID=UPI0018DEB088|nr:MULTISPECIES: trypsin-like peptidase domain-containing protein [unclassified Thermoactinomyces]MBH8597088.1 trypsin-like peptidase domain-containing protein [Thermoactinomyces sp. CICC 10523]MBH8602648.1 trypsin-like peptidase domain-containing protein [Thermoactinomyces sp. CICC 10522]MBH8606241.1 trypsin-like peptidase domain-containing protein [Thermoactinomyces sp. CICC 10521]
MSRGKLRVYRGGTQIASMHPANVFVSVFRRIKKSIVSIEADRRLTTGSLQRNLFDFLFPETHDFQANREGQFGSGFVIHPKGYILTNEHVIHQASRIRVKVEGIKHPLPATPIWADERKDLAVIRIPLPHPLKPLPLGTSANTQVGEWVLAVGNPYGLEQTVTVGVISGKNRPLRVGNRSYENVVQTDAAINPGNSGGPLVNILGEVIGINTLIIYPSQCIGFAIPIEDVRPHIQRFLARP